MNPRFFHSLVLMGLLLLAGLSLRAQQLVPGKARLAFTIRNAGVNVTGEIREADIELEGDWAKPASLKLKATAQVLSLKTGIGLRDRHLMGEDYFHQEKYPRITLESSSFAKTAQGWVLKGTLTMKDKSLPITWKLDLDVQGTTWVLKSQPTLNRRDYGIGGSSVTMGDEVRLDLSLEGSTR